MGEIKGTWKPEEDEALRKAVERAGDKNWMAVAREVNMALGYDSGGRTAKQCRGRYMHHLKPGLKRGPWTWEEEETLVRSHRRLGNSWSKIAKDLPGRTETDIKNHWNCTLRKKMPWDDSHRSPLQRYQLARGLSTGRAGVSHTPNGPSPPRHHAANSGSRGYRGDDDDDDEDDVAMGDAAAAAAAAAFAAYPPDVLVAAQDAAAELLESEAGAEMAVEAAAEVLHARGHPYEVAYTAVLVQRQHAAASAAAAAAEEAYEELGEWMSPAEGGGAVGDDDGVGGIKAEDQGSRAAGDAGGTLSAVAAAAALAGLVTRRERDTAPAAAAAAAALTPPRAVALAPTHVAGPLPVAALPLSAPLLLPPAMTLGGAATTPPQPQAQAHDAQARAAAALPLLAALSVDGPAPEVLRRLAAALGVLADSAEGVPGGFGEEVALMVVDHLRDGLLGLLPPSALTMGTSSLLPALQGMAPEQHDQQDQERQVQGQQEDEGAAWEDARRDVAAGDSSERKRRHGSPAGGQQPWKRAALEGDRRPADGAWEVEHPALVLPSAAGAQNGVPLAAAVRASAAAGKADSAKLAAGAAAASPAPEALQAVSGAEITAAMALAMAAEESDDDDDGDDDDNDDGDGGSGSGYGGSEQAGGDGGSYGSSGGPKALAPAPLGCEV